MYYIRFNFIKPLKCGNLSDNPDGIIQTITPTNVPFTEKSALCYFKYVVQIVANSCEENIPCKLGEISLKGLREIFFFPPQMLI